MILYIFFQSCRAGCFVYLTIFIQDHILVVICQAAQNGAAQMAHAVVIKKCHSDSFELKNSYAAVPIINIPKSRKTFYQHYVQASADEFNVSPKLQNIDVRRKFNSHSVMNIDWNTSVNDWLLMDEGYLLQFRLKKKAKLV